MPEPQREIIATRVALLELQDERRLANEGYELLDEKRILLATAIRHELAHLQALREACRQAENSAFDALQAAIALRGLDELAVYPALVTADDRLVISRSRLLGLELLAARWEAGPVRASSSPVVASPEIAACALAYRRWTAVLAQLAACSVSLRRLVREFTRTERRARAIENVLLPEIVWLVRMIEDRLAELDQEEIVRLRARRTSDPPLTAQTADRGYPP